MNLDRTAIRESVDRDTVRSVSKLLLAAVSLVFVLYLLTLLPGIDRIVPRTPITFAALVGVIVTIAMVALLLYLAPKLATLTKMTLEGPQVIVENLASVVYWLVVLVAVLVAHSGLAGAVSPLLDGIVWVYDVLFLLVALPAVAVIAVRLYASLGPGADILADTVVGAGEDEPSTSNEPVDSGEQA